MTLVLRSSCREESWKKGFLRNNCPLTRAAVTFVKIIEKNSCEVPPPAISSRLFFKDFDRFSEQLFFFRTTLSNCIFILMNFYFRWDNDFFLFSVFSVFFNWKDNTLDFLKTLLFILVCGPLVWTCSWQTGGDYLPPLPRVLIKIYFSWGSSPPFRKLKSIPVTVIAERKFIATEIPVAPSDDNN